MEKKVKPMALFDMDGTLTDYDGALKRDLEKIQSPHEPALPENLFDAAPYLEARRHIITSQVGWWLKLEKFKLGWDILEEVKKLGFGIQVLTKGPSRKYNAWSEKIEWCSRNLESYIDGVTITHNDDANSAKGMVYGRVLVDDYPDYITGWLKWRPRGLVIMPAHEFNKNFSHPNVLRYDGTNLDEVRRRLKEAFER